MIVACNRIPVQPEQAALFEDRFSHRARLVDGMPGFISFQLLRPTQPDEPYIVMTFWESEAAFRAWTKSVQFREGHARPLPASTLSGHPTVEVYEVIQKTM